LTGVRDIAAGSYHVLALKNDGTVWAWGKNYQGQLGDGGKKDRANPARVPRLTDIIAVAAGGYQSVALDRGGSVWVWGKYALDQVGPSGETLYSPSPIRVEGLPPIVAIACGEDHTLALDRDGFVWTWGHRNMTRKPVKVAGLRLI